MILWETVLVSLRVKDTKMSFEGSDSFNVSRHVSVPEIRNTAGLVLALILFCCNLCHMLVVLLRSRKSNGSKSCQTIREVVKNSVYCPNHYILKHPNSK